VADEIDELRRRIAASQDLPNGRCTRCSSATGKTAPHYARLEVSGLVMWLPFCAPCVEAYMVMAEAQRPDKAKKR
jgi:hypothetical protein